MQERVEGTSPEQPTVVVQFGHPSPDVGVGLESMGPGVETLLYDYAEAIGAQLAANLSEIGRAISDEFSDRKNSAHDIEFDDTLFGSMIIEAIALQVSMGEATMFTRMERGSVNRLIRLLRKARDTSFGRDE